MNKIYFKLKNSIFGAVQTFCLNSELNALKSGIVFDIFKKNYPKRVKKVLTAKDDYEDLFLFETSLTNEVTLFEFKRISGEVVVEFSIPNYYLKFMKELKEDEVRKSNN